MDLMRISKVRQPCLISYLVPKDQFSYDLLQLQGTTKLGLEFSVVPWCFILPQKPYWHRDRLEKAVCPASSLPVEGFWTKLAPSLSICVCGVLQSLVSFLKWVVLVNHCMSFSYHISSHIEYFGYLSQNFRGGTKISLGNHYKWSSTQLSDPLNVS